MCSGPFQFETFQTLGGHLEFVHSEGGEGCFVLEDRRAEQQLVKLLKMPLRLLSVKECSFYLGLIRAEIGPCRSSRPSCPGKLGYRDVRIPSHWELFLSYA